MATDHDVLLKTASHAVSGTGAHVESATVGADLDWKLAGARPEGAPHSVYQILNHMTYWLEWVVKWLDGQKPRPPKHAAGSWPGKVGPSSRKEWDQSVRQFRRALDEVDRCVQESDLFSRRGQKTRLEMLHVIGSHTSYHAGQVVSVRQMLGAWPPPSGGLTW